MSNSNPEGQPQIRQLELTPEQRAELGKMIGGILGARGKVEAVHLAEDSASAGCPGCAQEGPKCEGPTIPVSLISSNPDGSGAIAVSGKCGVKVVGGKVVIYLSEHEALGGRAVSIAFPLHKLVKAALK